MRAGNQLSGTVTYSYNGPAITSVSPLNGPTAGGFSITITGTSFGTSPTVTLGSQPCTITNSTHTSIVCTAPAGEGDAAVRVAVGSTDAIYPSNTGDVSFRYDAPVVTSINPTSGRSGGGETLTVVGTNFGLTGAVYFYIDGSYVPCVTQGVVTHTQILCTTPSGVGTAIPVQVLVAGTYSADHASSRWSYNPPYVTSVTPANGPTKGGTVLSIIGTSFSPSAVVEINGVVCPPTSSSDVTYTSIKCTSPAGSGTNLFVKVTASSLSNTALTNPEARFSYNAPAVTGMTPAAGETDGSTFLTITGTNFGAATCTLAAGAGPVLVNGLDCPLRYAWDHERLECAFPKGSGAVATVDICFAGDVDIATGVFANSWKNITSPVVGYKVPVITAITTASGSFSTDGSNIITITGTNFGYSGINTALITIIYASESVTCPLVASPLPTATQLVCHLPAGTANKNLVVTVDSQSSAPSTAIIRAAPVITSVTGDSDCDNSNPTTGPIDCPLTGAIRLTITGDNFGDLAATDANYLAITVGGVACLYVSQVTAHKQFVCELPASGAGGNNLPVVALTTTSKTTTFTGVSYSGPRIITATLRAASDVAPSGSTAIVFSVASTRSTESVTFRVEKLGSADVSVLEVRLLPSLCHDDIRKSFVLSLQ